MKELALKISQDYKVILPKQKNSVDAKCVQGESVLCVGLLTGAFVFVADLLRNLLVQYEVLKF